MQLDLKHQPRWDQCARLEHRSGVRRSARFESSNGSRFRPFRQSRDVTRGDLRVELFEVPGAQPLPEERRHPEPRPADAWQQAPCVRNQRYDSTERELKSRGADIVW